MSDLQYSSLRSGVVTWPSICATFVLAALALCVGCSSPSSTMYGPVCPNFLIPPPTLYLPTPGATGVPPGIGQLIVSFPVDGFFSIRKAGGSPVPVGPVTAAPSPLPSGVPTYNPSSAYHSVRIPALSPATTYSVYYAAAAGPPPCGSHEESGTLGSFTTR